MAGPYDPLPSGFRGFYEARPLGINGALQLLTRKKLSSSTNVIKKGHPLIVGTGGTYDLAAVTGGVNEIQTLTFGGTITGGTFTLTFTGPLLSTGVSTAVTTTAITYTSDFTVLAASVQMALQLLGNIGVDNVTVVRTSGTVLTLTYTNFLGSRNVAAIAYTSSLTGTSPTITVATGTAGTAGYISSTGLLGIADKFEKGSISSWQRQYPQPIDLNLDGKFWTDSLDMPIFPLRDQVFFANIEHDVAVTRALIDTTVDIGWYLTRSQAYLSSATAVNAIAKIVFVEDDQVNVVGGKVGFIIIASAIAVM